MATAWTRGAVDEEGLVLPRVTVEVFIAGTNTHADIYSDSGGTNEMENPFVTPSSGIILFYTNEDTVRIELSKAGIDFSEQNEALTDVSIC